MRQKKETKAQRYLRVARLADMDAITAQLLVLAAMQPDDEKRKLLTDHAYENRVLADTLFRRS